MEFVGSLASGFLISTYISSFTAFSSARIPGYRTFVCRDLRQVGAPNLIGAALTSAKLSSGMTSAQHGNARYSNHTLNPEPETLKTQNPTPQTLEDLNPKPSTPARSWVWHRVSVRGRGLTMRVQNYEVL